MVKKEFISLVVPPKEKVDPAWWFAIQGDKVLIQQESSAATIPRVVDYAEFGLEVLRQHYLGRLDGCHCYAVEVAEEVAAPHGMMFDGLRQIYGRIDEYLFALAGRALQIIDWDRTNQFCGRCGSETRTHATERAKDCPKCGLLNFPRLAPAIIVLVRRWPGNAVGERTTFYNSHVQYAGWFRRTWRNIGRSGRARGERREWNHCQGHPLLRKPTLALSAFAHDRFHRKLFQRPNHVE